MEGNIFQQEIEVNVPHNDFDLGFENRLTCNPGMLIPTAWYLCLPGDRFDVRSTINIQTVPMRSPAFANLRVYNATFAVPIRLLWRNFQEFISPSDPLASPIVHPYVEFDGKSPLLPGCLGDYLGLPVMKSTGVTPPNGSRVSALPQRCYGLIWNEWFRDESLMTTNFPVDLGDGADQYNHYDGACLQVCWKKDYFTSALKEPQFGNAAAASLNQDQTGVEVEEIRRANALQRWLEKASIVGHRYIESIFGHFGVRSKDARLQRPELIGFNSQPLRIDSVFQTSNSPDEDTPTATRYGAMYSNADFSLDDGPFYCDEHMIIMNLMFIRPEADYITGLAKSWKLWDRMDWPWPEFANLGDEAIKNHEIFWRPGHANDDSDWAYQSRYAWLKYHCNEIHGEFLSGFAHWTMPRSFGTIPPFNGNFVMVTDAACDNIFAFTSDEHHQFLCNVSHFVNANRPLPAFGTPSL